VTHIRSPVLLLLAFWVTRNKTKLQPTFQPLAANFCSLAAY